MIIVLTMFPIYRSTNKTKEQTDQLNLLNIIKTVLVKFSPYDVSWPKHSPNLKFEACSIISSCDYGDKTVISHEENNKAHQIHISDPNYKTKI